MVLSFMCKASPGLVKAKTEGVHPAYDRRVYAKNASHKFKGFS